MVTTIHGSCLARPMETQTSDSTGFQISLKQLIVDLYDSKDAYANCAIGGPIAKFYFLASLTDWAQDANSRVLEHLEKINKGECTEVLTLDFAMFCNKANWLSDRMKKDMMAFSDKPLKKHLKKWDSDETSMDLYQQYESNVFELAENLQKVKNSFNHPELYKNLMQQMQEQYTDSGIVYEYEQMKDKYVDRSLKNYLKMEVMACIGFLESGMLDDILSISNDEEDEVDEEKLYKLLDADYKKPDNLKKLWAKLMKFIEVKEGVLLILKHDKILKQVIKHFAGLNANHYSALFRLDKFLELIHKDMVELEPGLAKYLNQDDETNTFGIVNSLTRLIQQDWFKHLRTDEKFNPAWIEKLLKDLMQSDWGDRIIQEWQKESKRTKLKCMIIGAIKDAGVLNATYQTIAERMEMGSELPDSTLAQYMGYGKDQPFFDWICEYVKR